ncbi:MAG: outer membrane lipoprotein-sorting protein [Deltaproteobacteria bacterium]|nr:outer membrane lipoprotein-sorting protein [Deltaproteobacteria bacterium]
MTLKSLLLKKSILSLLLIPSTAFALTGREVIDRQESANRGYHDEIHRGEMILTGPSGDSTVREFEVRRLEKKGVAGDKSLIRIIKPADLNGTALLSWQNKGGNDDQWLYLPALRKTTRIIGQGKTGRFIGSEFTYEDLLPPEADQYRYEWLREESCSGGSCHVLEAFPLFSNSGYSKTILFIDKNDYQNVRIDFFDKKGRLVKRGLFEDRKKIGNFTRAHRITMDDLAHGRKTVLAVKEIRIGSGLTDAAFTKTVLER